MKKKILFFSNTVSSTFLFGFSTIDYNQMHSPKVTFEVDEKRGNGKEERIDFGHAATVEVQA